MTNNKNKSHVISIVCCIQISDCYFNFSSITILEIDAMWKKWVNKSPDSIFIAIHIKKYKKYNLQLISL